jgi:hypothetical protein
VSISGVVEMDKVPPLTDRGPVKEKVPAMVEALPILEMPPAPVSVDCAVAVNGPAIVSEVPEAISMVPVTAAELLILSTPESMSTVPSKLTGA